MNRVETSHACNLAGCDISKEPPFAFKNELPENRVARCRYCKGVELLMDGDGDQVACFGCAAVLGKIAGDPSSIADGILEDLVAKHGDVVELVVDGDTRSWRWTNAWPVAGA